jgi:hypothetical protein
MVHEPSAFGNIYCCFSIPAHLARGELLNTAQFTLLEAMSAIEVMDAKMDVGMQRQRIDELGYEHALKVGD